MMEEHFDVLCLCRLYSQYDESVSNYPVSIPNQMLLEHNLDMAIINFLHFKIVIHYAFL